MFLKGLTTSHRIHCRCLTGKSSCIQVTWPVHCFSHRRDSSLVDFWWDSVSLLLARGACHTTGYAWNNSKMVASDRWYSNTVNITFKTTDMQGGHCRHSLSQNYSFSFKPDVLMRLKELGGNISATAGAFDTTHERVEG